MQGCWMIEQNQTVTQEQQDVCILLLLFDMILFLKRSNQLASRRNFFKVNYPQGQELFCQRNYPCTGFAEQQ